MLITFRSTYVYMLLDWSLFVTQCASAGSQLTSLCIHLRKKSSRQLKCKLGIKNTTFSHRPRTNSMMTTFLCLVTQTVCPPHQGPQQLRGPGRVWMLVSHGKWQPRRSCSPTKTNLLFNVYTLDTRFSVIRIVLLLSSVFLE